MNSSITKSRLQKVITAWRVCLIVLICVLSMHLVVTAATDTDVNEEAIVGPGDRKQGYDKESYVTNSLSIDARTGEEADLLQFVLQPPLGLPELQIPQASPGKPIRNP